MPVMSDDEIYDWLVNKNVNTRKRILLVLSESTEGIGSTQLSRIINSNKTHTWRTLAKMKIDGYTNQKPNHKWFLPNKGVKQLKRYQEHGSIPTRKI